MRESLRGVGLMLKTSWRADKVRSVLAAVTATGQFVVLPVRAVGLKVLTDSVVSHNLRGAVEGGLLIVALGAVNRLMAWASLNIRVRLREHTQLYLDTHLMDLTAGIPGVEHHELPEYLDSMRRLRDERPYLANPFNPISWTLASVLQTVTVVALLAGVRPWLALLPLCGLPAGIAAARAEGRMIALLDIQAEGTRGLQHLMELATEPAAAKEVRIFGLGDEVLRRRAHTFAELESVRMRQAAGNMTTVAVGWVIFSAAFAAALGWTASAAAAGREPVGAVVLVFTLGAQLNTQLAELAFNVTWFARSLRAVRRLVWFSDYATSTHARYATGDASPPSRMEVGIELSHVSFAYPGAERKVLDDLTLILPAGTTVAVVGENGSGKTTLVKLLARMYAPSSGRMLVDGEDLQSFDIDRWRVRISAGFQDFARLELVARDAVGVGDASVVADDAAVAAALDRAASSDILAGLPAGFATQLGRQFNGVDLSLGQWQKIALGRAMMRTTPLLLILDEPTASLDAPTEHALFERFAGAGRDVAGATGGITVLISHRFSTVRMADLIVVMAHGAIAEVGTHDELVAAGGLYAELYRLQARAYRVH